MNTFVSVQCISHNILLEFEHICGWTGLVTGCIDPLLFCICDNILLTQSFVSLQHQWKHFCVSKQCASDFYVAMQWFTYDSHSRVTEVIILQDIEELVHTNSGHFLFNISQTRRKPYYRFCHKKYRFANIVYETMLIRSKYRNRLEGMSFSQKILLIQGRWRRSKKSKYAGCPLPCLPSAR